MSIHKAQVTGQDRFNPYRFPTMYRGMRYDIDVKHNRVWSYEVSSRGSKAVMCHNDEVINAVKLALGR